MWWKEAIPGHTSKDDLVEKRSKLPKELKHCTKALDVNCHAWRTKLIDRRGEIQPGETIDIQQIALPLFKTAKAGLRIINKGRKFI